MPKHSEADELQLVEQAAYELFEMWQRHRRKVARYVEPTVQLVQREGYLASSFWMGPCDLVAICPDHLLLGYVSAHDWPTAEELEMLRQCPAPPGTRKVVFRWHSLKGVPDRRHL